MSVGTAGAIALGVGSMAGGIASGAIGANAAGNAADAQTAAANHAADLQAQAQQNALQFQQGVWQQQQQNESPFLQSGAGATSTLDRLMGLNAPNIPANYGQPMPLSALNGQTAPRPSGNYAPGKPTFNDVGNRWKGGPVEPSKDYIVGEKGPEHLKMFPNGTGVVIPLGHQNLKKLMARAGGGPVGYQPPMTPGGGGVVAANPGLGSGQQFTASPVLSNQPGVNGNPAGGERAVSGQPVGSSGLAGPGSVAPGITSGQLSPFTSWNQQFQAPTSATEQNDPGYQFRLQQGEKALQNSAAAQGNLLTGNTAAGINAYGQDYASNEFGNVYNRAYQQYQDKYNIFKQNQADQFNRLAAIAGLGQTAVGQLNSAGSNAGSNIGNTYMQGSQQIGNSLQNAGAAQASGYVGGANAINGGISAGVGGLQQMMLLNQLQNQGYNPSQDGR